MRKESSEPGVLGVPRCQVAMFFVTLIHTVAVQCDVRGRRLGGGGGMYASFYCDIEAFGTAESAFTLPQQTVIG